MNKYFLIMNPGSKNGTSGKKFDEIFSFFKHQNLSYDFRETKSLNDAQRFSREACRDGYTHIIAVGGDGTINRVINGMYERGRKISEAQFGVIYTGTSPDFCKSFNIPITLDEALNTLLKDRKIGISLGEITYASKPLKEYSGKKTDSSSSFEHSCFACCSNIGIGADLAEAANSGVRGFLGDFLGTFLSLIRTLFTYKPSSFSIVADGIEKQVDNVHSISIGKTHFIASGIKITNSLSRSDHRFYSLIVKNLNLFRVPKVLASIYSGKAIEQSNTLNFEYVETLEILGDSGDKRVEFDGDPQGYLPCRISSIKEHLQIITGDENGI